MISLGAFLIVLAALGVTLLLLVIVLVGSANMRDAERTKTDTIAAAYRAEVADHERTREAYHQATHGDDVLIVPLSESGAARRIAAVIAHNEAGRFDPDVEDWTPVMPEDRA